MSDLLASQFRVTHLGVVRVDFGDAGRQEIKMPWQASGETAPVARAPFAVQMTYANAVNEITFDRVLAFDNSFEARNAMLAHNAGLSSDVGDAVIETLDGDTYTLRGARLTSVSPRIEDGCRFVCDYTLTGGQLDGGTTSTTDLGDRMPLDVRSALAGDTSSL